MGPNVQLLPEPRSRRYRDDAAARAEEPARQEREMARMAHRDLEMARLQQAIGNMHTASANSAHAIAAVGRSEIVANPPAKRICRSNASNPLPEPAVVGAVSKAKSVVSARQPTLVASATVVFPSTWFPLLSDPAGLVTRASYERPPLGFLERLGHPTEQELLAAAAWDRRVGLRPVGLPTAAAEPTEAELFAELSTAAAEAELFAELPTAAASMADVSEAAFPMAPAAEPPAAAEPSAAAFPMPPSPETPAELLPTYEEMMSRARALDDWNKGLDEARTYNPHPISY